MMLSMTQWKAIFGIILGVALGWLTHPMVWLPVSLFGPFRLISLVLACANQESGFNPLAEGDIGNKNGSSVGVLQFNYSRWPSLTNGRDLDDRKSCFWSGYYAVVYIEDALQADWDWWWHLRTPVLCLASIRWMWTHGPAEAPAFADAWPAMKAEGRTWKGYLILSAIFVPIGLFFIAALSFLTMGKKGLKVVKV